MENQQAEAGGAQTCRSKGAREIYSCRKPKSTTSFPAQPETQTIQSNNQNQQSHTTHSTNGQPRNSSATGGAGGGAKEIPSQSFRPVHSPSHNRSGNNPSAAASPQHLLAAAARSTHMEHMETVICSTRPTPFCSDTGDTVQTYHRSDVFCYSAQSGEQSHQGDGSSRVMGGGTFVAAAATGSAKSSHLQGNTTPTDTVACSSDPATQLEEPMAPTVVGIDLSTRRSHVCQLGESTTPALHSREHDSHVHQNRDLQIGPQGHPVLRQMHCDSESPCQSNYRSTDPQTNLQPDSTSPSDPWLAGDGSQCAPRCDSIPTTPWLSTGANCKTHPPRHTRDATDSIVTELFCAIYDVRRQHDTAPVEQDIMSIIASIMIESSEQLDITMEPFIICPGSDSDNIRVLFPKCPQGHPRREHCLATLDDITSSRLNLDLVLSWMPPEVALDVRRLLRGDLFTNCPIRTTRTVSRYFNNDDWDVLQRSDISSDLDAVFNNPVFKVLKSNGLARFIMDCREINALLPRPPKLNLPDIDTILRDISRFSHVVTWDARAFFYQIPLGSKAQRYFGFRLGMSRHAFFRRCLRVLPMGLSWAPFIAQSCATAIASRIRAALGHAGAVHVWIDNFIIACNDVQHAQHVAQLVFTEANIIGGPFIVDSGCLGFQFSRDPIHGTLTIEPTDKFVEAWRRHPIWFRQDINQREFLTCCGSLMWIIRHFGRTPLCFFPRFLQQMSDTARLGARQQWSHQFFASPLSLAHLRSELDKLKSIPLTRTIKPYIEPLPNLVTWSDATLSTAGIVAASPSVEAARYVPLDEAPIFLQELKASIIGASIAPTVLITDNTGVYHSILKGHSTSVVGNRLLCILYALGTIHAVGWIGTKLNRSDGPSRKLPMGPQVALPPLAQTRFPTRRFERQPPWRNRV